MPLTTEHLESTTHHWSGTGAHLTYKFPSGWGLSVIPYPCLPFEHRRGDAKGWEIAIVNPDGKLDYSTALTCDVECFDNDDEANAFIARAAKEIG